MYILAKNLYKNRPSFLSIILFLKQFLFQESLLSPLAVNSKQVQSTKFDLFQKQETQS